MCYHLYVSINEGDSMIITATELKKNLGKYLDMVSSENVLITKNGKIIAQLSNPVTEKLAALDRLTGLAKSDEDVSLKQIRDERVSRL